MADSPDTRAQLRSTWAGTERPVPRVIIRPIQRFMHQETASGIVLAAAALLALIWANFDIASYERFWHYEVVLGIGPLAFEDSLRHVVNDGLMALFFFVIGLEIKREIVDGELSDRRAALLPLFAAIGGMLLPAIIYVALTRGAVGGNGWGIPMATDIAFALGVLALLGRRVPMALKVLLLGIAVIDDVGAIVIIAIFYSSGIELQWLLVAAAGLLAIEAGKRLHVRSMAVYVVVGAFVWLATYESGVHATIAGVAIGLMAPTRPFQRSDAVSDEARHVADITSDEHDDPDEDAAAWRRLSVLSRQAIAPLTYVEHALHPWTSYVVLPLFALANVGVVLDPQIAWNSVTSPVGLGIILGLVLGKPLGVLLGGLISVRLGLAVLPDHVTWLHMTGIGALAGIGFTVSLFITTLAFDAPALVTSATFSVLAASALAGTIGAAVLLWANRHTPDPPLNESDHHA